MSTKPTVWILFGSYDYEGSSVLAVLDSEKEAEDLKQWGEENKTGLHPNHQSLRWGYDSLHIEKWAIGGRSDRLPTKA